MMHVLRDELHRVKSKVGFYLGLGRFQVAERLLQSTLDDYGPLANIHNLLGVTYHKQSRFPEALAQFKKAQECNPAYTEATLNMVATLCDLSCYEQAQHIYEALRQKEIQREREHALSSELLQGRLADRHAQCGLLYAELGHFDKAIAEYEKALSLHRRMPEVKLALAQIYIDTEQLPRAQKELDELIALAPNLAKPYTLLGIVHYKLGKQGLATQAWEKARQLSPEDPVTIAYLQVAATWSPDQGLPPAP